MAFQFKSPFFSCSLGNVPPESSDLNISVSDSIALTENTQVSLGIQTTVNDTISVSEAVRVDIPINITVSDTITVSEATIIALSDPASTLNRLRDFCKLFLSDVLNSEFAYSFGLKNV